MARFAEIKYFGCSIFWKSKTSKQKLPTDEIVKIQISRKAVEPFQRYSYFWNGIIDIEVSRNR